MKNKSKTMKSKSKTPSPKFNVGQRVALVNFQNDSIRDIEFEKVTKIYIDEEGISYSLDRLPYAHPEASIFSYPQLIKLIKKELEVKDNAA